MNLADEVARLMFAAWPRRGRWPDSQRDPQRVHNHARRRPGAEAVFAVYFASSGIESLRIGLNRAYSLQEQRSFWLLRLESIRYVLVSAIALIALAFLAVLQSGARHALTKSRRGKSPQRVPRQAQDRTTLDSRWQS